VNGDHEHLDTPVSLVNPLMQEKLSCGTDVVGGGGGGAVVVGVVGGGSWCSVVEVCGTVDDVEPWCSVVDV
jgi:hypothetical protein